MPYHTHFHTFIYSFIHSSIHSFIHSFIKNVHSQILNQARRTYWPSLGLVRSLSLLHLYDGIHAMFFPFIVFLKNGHQLRVCLSVNLRTRKLVFWQPPTQLFGHITNLMQFQCNLSLQIKSIFTKKNIQRARVRPSDRQSDSVGLSVCPSVWQSRHSIRWLSHRSYFWRPCNHDILKSSKHQYAIHN